MHELDDYDVVDDDEFWHRVAADCTERAFVFLFTNELSSRQLQKKCRLSI